MADTEIMGTFDNLPLADLIGAPLIAAVEAQEMTARTIVEYIRRIGLNQDGTVEELRFFLDRRVASDQGRQAERVEARVPLLSLVPIPSLLVETIDVRFSVEAKASLSFREAQDSQQDITTPVVVGNLRSSRESTRQSDQSARYDIALFAKQGGLPEGMARLLDILAENIHTLPAASTEQPE